MAAQRLRTRYNGRPITTKEKEPHLQGWPEPYIYGVYTVVLAGKSPNIRSYTVYIYGSGQPYTFGAGYRKPPPPQKTEVNQRDGQEGAGQFPSTPV
jgi:hypothetical protein